MLNRDIIGKHGELKAPTMCAVTGYYLGRNFVTVSIGYGYYIRYRSSAQHLFTTDVVDKYRAMVKPATTAKKKNITPIIEEQ